MKITRILAILALAGSLSVAVNVSTGVAQIGEQQPAEFPPASYKGKQYVDSKGCVFIRAGIDGDVSWIPRVSRDRKLICGFRPSLAGEVAEAVPEAKPAEPAAEAPAPQVAAVAEPKPKPRRVAQAPAPKPKPRAKPRVVRQTAPAPKPRVVAQAPAPSVEQRVVVAPPASACVGASALSQQYLRGSGVRCGPQAERILPIRVATAQIVPDAPAGQVVVRTKRIAGAPKLVSRERVLVTQAAPAAPVAAPRITAETRIAPKHVVENRINTRNVQVPKGYRKVWTDGRLNPHRAEQNLAGRADMLLVWTQTVPRRLIDRRSGRDVTAKVPLIYPYTSIAQQERELGQVALVTRDGQVMKRIKRNPGATRAPVYSSRSAPKAVTPKVPATRQALASPRYVQVGTYRNPDNAQRAAQSIARMGLRARIGKVRRSGATYMTVQAGPFTDSTLLQRAVRQLRGAGYADAFVR